MPNCFAKMASALCDNPEGGFVYGRAHIVDADRKKIYTRKIQFNGKQGLIRDIEPYIATLTSGIQPGSLMDLNLVRRVGGIDETLNYTMDADLGLRIALIKPPVSIDKPVVYCRTYSGAKTYLYNSRRAEERLRIARKLFDNNSMPTTYKKIKQKAFATAHEYAWKNYVVDKNYWPAFKHAVMDDVSSRRMDFRLWTFWKVLHQLKREIVVKLGIK